MNTYAGSILIFLLVFVSTAGSAQNLENRSPIDDLPSYITRITHFGQRADWSHDGQRILFIEKTFGDVFEVNVETGVIRPMTHYYFHEGYTRALYLSNGDILLSGSRTFDSSNPWESRDEEQAELWVLDKDLTSPPVPLGEHCSEGPAVSRSNLKIAWVRNNAIFMANISYEGDKPSIRNKEMILNSDNLDFKAYLETQNFRPPEENEIIFSAYEYQGTEVMGVNIETGEITNYSHQDNQYDEPEGIYPSGKYTLVESDRHKSKGKEFQGIQSVDIHRLVLDGSGNYHRITYFNDHKGYKSSNPVVSDDGNYIAFQVAHVGDAAGVGRGIFILDIQKWEKAGMEE
ncbi:hypothetical protein NC796_03410 [Aliifodinibius sp. S!AR15-10]|uniref:hypothetical protein n=1 Tax=Aliifodinibius sp. S!AR15-10 TaxID=2950437 RepID=UPI0028586260|nr:hypothetical protein [Aliifodinibius sp. S!AR15-10]MDR8390174.1 hypothetical protein [Aliifodinibius sp. S!AR15-10]